MTLYYLKIVAGVSLGASLGLVVIAVIGVWNRRRLQRRQGAK